MSPEHVSPRAGDYHPAAWTPEQIARFWNFASSGSSRESAYFAVQVGDTLVREVQRLISLEGVVLDFGCGIGGLLKPLLKRGIACMGVDFSREAVEQVRQTYGGKTGFRGAETISRVPTDLSAGTFDTIFLLETVEHVMDETLGNLIREVHRLLKPGGNIVITTPNQEDLPFKHVACPECGCVFHRVQHVRSWSKETLVSWLQNSGFDTVACRETFFMPPIVIPGTLLSRIFHLLHRLGPGKTIIKFLPFGTGERLPHLFYIGRKRTEATDGVPATSP